MKIMSLAEFYQKVQGGKRLFEKIDEDPELRFRMLRDAKVTEHYFKGFIREGLSEFGAAFLMNGIRRGRIGCRKN